MGRTKAIAALGVALCACAGPPRITVGSKNFTEQIVIGEIVAQQIERRLDTAVDRRLNLGGTLLAHQALVHGEIGIYPEYTGTALMAVLDLPPLQDAGAVFARVRREYRERFEVEWLAPLGFNNSFAMVVRGGDARAGGLKTISDAAAHPGGWRLGLGYEFERRADGLPALEGAYPLKWSAPPVTMDLGLLYRALEQGQVNMVAANGTDGLLAAMDVRVLQDDRGVFPPYEAAVLVRADLLRHYSGLREALAGLSGTIDADTMRRLNYRVDVEHRPVEEVARGFLAGRESR